MTTQRSADEQSADSAKGFLRKVTVSTGGGMFIDGFVFASFAAALAGEGMSHTIGTGGCIAVLRGSGPGRTRRSG